MSLRNFFRKQDSLRQELRGMRGLNEQMREIRDGVWRIVNEVTYLRKEAGILRQLRNLMNETESDHDRELLRSCLHKAKDNYRATYGPLKVPEWPGPPDEEPKSIYCPMPAARRDDGGES